MNWNESRCSNTFRVADFQKICDMKVICNQTWREWALRHLHMEGVDKATEIGLSLAAKVVGKMLWNIYYQYASRTVEKIISKLLGMFHSFLYWENMVALRRIKTEYRNNAANQTGNYNIFVLKHLYMLGILNSHYIKNNVSYLII